MRFYGIEFANNELPRSKQNFRLIKHLSVGFEVKVVDRRRRVLSKRVARRGTLALVVTVPGLDMGYLHDQLDQLGGWGTCRALTVVEERRLGVSGRRPRGGGGGRGAAAAPLANHVDLLVGLVGQLRRRGRLPLLGHEAARHGGARIGLSATASARDRRTEKKREKRKSGAPGERLSRRSRASSCGCGDLV